MSTQLSEPRERGVLGLDTPHQPDIQPQPVRNVPSPALISGLSQQVEDLQRSVGGLRRRLWWERGFFVLVLGGIAAAWMGPQMFPSVWAFYADGKPIVAMRDQAAVQAILVQAKQQASGNSGALQFLDRVEIRRADPAKVQITDPQTAAERLQQSQALHQDRGVIYVDGNAVVALPDAAEANTILDRVKSEAAGKLDNVDGEPSFKQEVEVRTEPAPQELWADADTGRGLLMGEGTDGESTHTVRSGESAWVIARGAGISLQKLQELNPSVNLQRLRLGQELRVGKPGDPIVSVVTTGHVTETVSTPFRTLTTPRPKMWLGKRVRAQVGAPGAERVTYRVVAENGKIVRREVLDRTTLRPAKDQIMAVGTKPR